MIINKTEIEKNVDMKAVCEVFLCSLSHLSLLAFPHNFIISF